MAKAKSAFSLKKAAGAAGIIWAAAELIPAMAKTVQPAIETHMRLKRDNTVTVPTLHKKGFALSVDKASELLSNYNLKALANELNVSDAHAKYKNCFAGQVVDCSPKQGQKVTPGSTVILKYVPQEVIDASQALFEEEEKRKAEAKQVNSEKRAARAEHAKTLAADTAKKAKDGLLKVLPHGKKPPESPEAEPPCEESAEPMTDM